METGKKDFSDRAKLRYGVALLSFQTAVTQIALGFKAGFQPDQPRVPAGNPDGGQWTDEDGSGSDGASSVADLVIPVGGRGRRPGGQVRIGNRWLTATPAQQFRLSRTRNAMNRSIAEAKRLDSDWKPRAQTYETVEGFIQANEANRLEAELRIWQLTGRQPTLGPFAREWLTSPAPGLRLTESQRLQLDPIGRLYGCHGCGSVSNLTPGGHFVADHHVSRALGKPSRIVPHCVTCSAKQGA